MDQFILPNGMIIDFSNLLGTRRLDKTEINNFIKKYTENAKQNIDNMRKNGIAKAHYSKDGELEHVYFLRMPYVKELFSGTACNKFGKQHKL